jgi:hypothetical protein
MHFPQAPTQVIWLLFLKCRAELFQRGGESYNVFDVGVKHFFSKTFFAEETVRSETFHFKRLISFLFSGRFRPE